MTKQKKVVSAALSLILAVLLCIPALSFADSPSNSDPLQETVDSSDLSAVQIAEMERETEAAGESAPSDPTAEITSADKTGDCTATIKYYENATWLEPGYEPNEDGRYFMGERVITGLSEGDVLDAWDYVIDIKGFFFFDGWPGKLTISNDPDKNVIELIYFREWSSIYTVNYYMMVGADLTADTWAGALAPSGVEFIKFDTEVFENQPYGMLVEGDAYEYRLDGKYVVDSYPPQIRVGSDADNNVLNILYVPDSTHLPDDIEIPDDIFSNGGGNDGSSESSTSGSASPTLPEDEVLDKDEMEGLLPDGLTEKEIDELFRDFLGSQADAGQLEITDEMLANPLSKETALQRIDAYKAGLEQGRAQSDQQDGSQVEDPLCNGMVWLGVIILLLILGIIGYILFIRERRRNAILQKQLEGNEPPKATI